MGLKTNTPRGTSDIYERNCARKSYLERNLIDLFLAYGYKKIETPVTEYSNIFNRDICNIPQKEIFRMFNNTGDVLALRADELIPVARVASSQSDKTISTRFSYLSNVFRNKEKGLSEYTKAGVFVAGDNRADIDAEIIVLAVKALIEAGLDDFRISIGYTGFSKNTSIKRLKGKEEILTRACELTKDRKTVDAIKRLADIYRILGYYNVLDYIDFDFEIEDKNCDYTGIIFIGHFEGKKQILLKGGRYDNVIGKFGEDIPAAGFSININRLLKVIDHKNYSIKHEHVVIYTNSRRKDAIIIGEYFRYKDLNIELIKNDGCSSKKDYITAAYKKDALSIMFFDREKTIVVDLVNSKITNIY